MAKKYEWSAALTVESGGYTGEEISVGQNGQTIFVGAVDNPPQTIDTGWTRTSTLSGSGSYIYTYRDSNSGDNNNSSRVVIDTTESWTASIDNRNYLTISLSTVVNSIYRDDVRGNPLIGGNATRELYLRRSNNGPLLWSAMNDNISYVHTIMSTPLVLDNYSFTLAPGEDLTRGSLYFRDNTNGHGGDTPPSYYVDVLWVGLHFKNILPKDYRPGATLDTDTSIWKSHNRTNGACHILSNTSNMTWQECRTLDGDDGGQGDPPLILHAANDNSWYNQKRLGKE